MRIGFGQIFVVSLILFLLFGDIQNFKKKVVLFINQIKEIFNQK